MAFIVEDGTGLPNANSYSDVAYADEYFEERGVTAWTGDDTQKQAWLVQATDYIEQVFGARFVGEKKTAEQSLSWPRSYAVARDGATLADDMVPTSLMRACCQYALRAIDGPLMLGPTFLREVTTLYPSALTSGSSMKVGPIEKEFKVMGSSGNPILVRSYPAADSLITGLLRAGIGGTRVIR